VCVNVASMRVLLLLLFFVVICYYLLYVLLLFPGGRVGTFCDHRSHHPSTRSVHAMSVPSCVGALCCTLPRCALLFVRAHKQPDSSGPHKGAEALMTRQMTSLLEEMDNIERDRPTDTSAWRNPLSRKRACVRCTAAELSLVAAIDPVFASCSAGLHAPGPRALALLLAPCAASASGMTRTPSRVFLREDLRGEDSTPADTEKPVCGLAASLLLFVLSLLAAPVPLLLPKAFVP
jgi:hypothetical protein